MCLNVFPVFGVMSFVHVKGHCSEEINFIPGHWSCKAACSFIVISSVPFFENADRGQLRCPELSIVWGTLLSKMSRASPVEFRMSNVFLSNS